MTTMTSLVSRIRETPYCSVQPYLGLPITCCEHKLPDDVKEFYQLCGGATLNEDASDPITIVAPDKLVLTNTILLVQLDEETIAYFKDSYGLSWSWYAIVDYGNGNYVSIDLSYERLGHCYDSDHELHPNDSYIVANSFTELLTWLLDGYTDKDSDPPFKDLGSPFA